MKSKFCCSTLRAAVQECPHCFTSFELSTDLLIFSCLALTHDIVGFYLEVDSLVVLVDGGQA